MPEEPTEDQIRDRLIAYYAGEMADRRQRPLPRLRAERVADFARRLGEQLPASVLELGCGAGRDGVILAGSGAAYVGIDLSPAAVEICRERGLDAREASATALPLAEDSVDAVWSMSTLMHLTDDQQRQAIAEVARVVRPGGLVEIGVWGHDSGLTGPDSGGRHFNRRTDGGLRTLLAPLGTLEAFETWDHQGEHHYQWARLRV